MLSFRVALLLFLLFFGQLDAITDPARSTQMPEAEDAKTTGKGKKVATRKGSLEGEGPVIKLLQDILSASLCSLSLCFACACAVRVVRYLFVRVPCVLHLGRVSSLTPCSRIVEPLGDLKKSLRTGSTAVSALLGAITAGSQTGAADRAKSAGAYQLYIWGKLVAQQPKVHDSLTHSRISSPCVAEPSPSKLTHSLSLFTEHGHERVAERTLVQHRRQLAV